MIYGINSNYSPPFTGGARGWVFFMTDFDDILVNGISFSRGGTKPKEDDGKVKTKAKKKKYITGAHGSGSAKQKAKYREQRANRHK